MFGDLRDDLESQVTSTHELQWKASSMHAGKGVSTQERKSVTQGLDERPDIENFSKGPRFEN